MGILNSAPGVPCTTKLVLQVAVKGVKSSLARLQAMNVLDKTHR